MTAIERWRVGDTVLLKQPHPHAGKTGAVVGHDVLGLLPHLGARPRVRFDNGDECYLVDDKDGVNLSATGRCDKCGRRMAHYRLKGYRCQTCD